MSDAVPGFGEPAGGFDEQWLSLLYQFPVGVVVCDDAGVVELINPAAARMLLPALPVGADLSRLFPLLDVLAPDLVEVITGDRRRLGRLDAGRRVIVLAAGGRQEWRELVTTRLDVDRILLTVLDVTVERRLAAREHQIAVELQDAMLGRVDPVPGLPVGVVYRAAAEEMAIGGDWYDVVDGPGDRVTFIVGDVCGHNLAATAVMGQMRSAVRAIAASCTGPADLLRRAGLFADGIDGAECCTVAVVVLERGTGLVTYSCAGHLPPLLVPAGSAPRFLLQGRHPPLACPTTRSPVEAVEQLQASDVVVLYCRRPRRAARRGSRRRARAPAPGGRIAVAARTVGARCATRGSRPGREGPRGRRLRPDGPVRTGCIPPAVERDRRRRIGRWSVTRVDPAAGACAPPTQDLRPVRTGP